MRLLHEACQRGLAAVVVTHDAHLGAQADRMMTLRDGWLTGPSPVLAPGTGQ
jgi:putative ABC transport system ATP-binding protein